VEVQVLGLLVDEETKSPVVILRAVEGEETLPIRIGMPEAAAIAAVLEEVDLPAADARPVPARAGRRQGAGGRRRGDDLRDETYFAVLKLRVGRRTLSFDARLRRHRAVPEGHAPMRVRRASSGRRSRGT